MEKERKDFPFEIKADDIQASGVFKGYGSLFDKEPDSYGDIIMPGAFKESLSRGGRNGTGVAMLWQHDPSKPLGVWNQIYEDAKGLYVEGQLAMNTQLGKEAHELMKMGAVRGLSIGYQVDKDGYEIDDKIKSRNLKVIDLWEISPVTFPAKIRANITGVKAMIESARTERQLEEALRDAGLTIGAAKYIVGLCKESLADRNKSGAETVLEALRDARADIRAMYIRDELRATRKLLQNLK
jgi:hypothetical protein